MNHKAMLNAVFQEVRGICTHMLQAYDRVNTVHTSKSNKEEFVQSIDAEIQYELISSLKRIYPDHQFLAEEPNQDASQTMIEAENLWIIDPIDGSTNFSHHIPFFSISICYYYLGKPKVALVYDPINDELFTAIHAEGAQLNQHRIRTSQSVSFENAICGIELRSLQAPLNRIQTLPIHRLRKLGSTSLAICYVACGRLDIAICETPKIWDRAAGMLIAQEAGARCYNESKKEYSDSDHFLIVSSPDLQQQMPDL